MSHKPSPYTTELKRVRGLGAAHEGTHHFWVQRMTALALIPLSVWFLFKLLVVFLSADITTVSMWFVDPVNAILLALFIIALFMHARLGIQVIIEDYVHCECAKITALVLSSAIHIILGLGSLFAIAHLHFVGN